MRAQRLFDGLLICLLGIAATGCGSDDGAAAQTGSAQTAGDSAGAALSPRPTGSMGPEQCIAATTQVFSERDDGYEADCVKCLCGLSPQSVASCNDQADQCWRVLSCVRASCADLDDTESSKCAEEKCGQSAEVAELVLTLQAFIGGNLCSAGCSFN